MSKIAVTVRPAHFDRFGIQFPKEWDVSWVKVPYTDEDLIAAAKDAEFLFVDSIDPVSANVIRNCPKLKMIHTEGVGFNTVDVAAAKEAGVYVCNNRGVNNYAVAEHTIGLILAALRRIGQATVQIREEGYETCQKKQRAMGEHELRGQRLGIVGFGAIGREIARLLYNWGVEIVYNDAFRPSEEVEKALNVKYLELPELIATCDIISLHAPVLPSTINMISREQLKAMKPNALLVNTARGELVNAEDLAEALEAGEIYGAALDTLTPEPAPKDHVLLNLSKEAEDKLILTPHIAGTTNEAFYCMLTWAIANFQRLEKGEKPNNVVNGL